MYPNPFMRTGLLSRGLNLTKAINWGGLLDGTQKTLGVINQAIPIVYQVKPIINNARTMFKIADEIRSPNRLNDANQNNNFTKTSINKEKTSTINSNRPIFYM